MTRDEALQTCAEVFSYCRYRYCLRRGLGVVDNGAWFMSLYKQALMTRFHKEAERSTHIREADATFADTQKTVERETTNLGETLAAVSTASEELREVLRVIASAPAELVELLLRADTDDARWSRRLCRLCGIRVNGDVVTELRQLAGGRGAGLRAGPQKKRLSV